MAAFVFAQLLQFHAIQKCLIHSICDATAGWRATCVRANISGRVMHDFLRTAVRNLERAGVPRDVARRLTRHTTESVYARYHIVNSRDLSDAVMRWTACHSYLDSTRKGAPNGQSPEYSPDT